MKVIPETRFVLLIRYMYAFIVPVYIAIFNILLVYVCIYMH